MDIKKLKPIAQFIISIILLTLSIYLVVTEPEESTKLKWAFATIGIIIGYWLK